MNYEITAIEQDALTAGHCPDCSSRGFVLGPIGGMAQNIECANLACRARFNVALFAGRVLHAHRIDRASEGGIPWPSEPQGEDQCEDWPDCACGRGGPDHCT